jgi:hypothetical protein
MTHFEVTVRLFDVSEANASAARRTIDERLRIAGFSRWQIVDLGPQAAITAPARTARGTGPPADSPTHSDFAILIGVLLFVLLLLLVLGG